MSLSFPSSVAPQPEMWLSLDDFFQFCHVAFRQLIVGDVFDVVGHEAQSQAVLSASFALHVGEKHGGIHFLCNAFRSSEDRRVLVQEVHPVSYFEMLSAPKRVRI